MTYGATTIKVTLDWPVIEPVLLGLVIDPG